jgi:serine/threonine protein kinase
MADIRVFGEYYLGKRIATGGNSELFRARRVGLSGFERLLAIKTILPHYAGHPEFLTMFINEAKLASRLHHSNIVQILDLGRVDETYFIAMEYVFGRSLTQLMTASRDKNVYPSTENVVTLVSRVATALDYAHRLTDNQGQPVDLVHRDISPHNILLSFEGEVKLVDFGIAKAASLSGDTRAGVLKGKIAYMSPQQAGGQPVDRRSDIYSLGIVFHELLCRRKLFTGDSEMTVLQKVTKPTIQPPSKLCDFVPAALDPIVMKALAPAVEDRYQTAGELADALESFLHAQGTVSSTFDLRHLMRTAFVDQIAVEQQEIQAEERAMSDLARTEPEAQADFGDRTLVMPAPPAPPEPTTKPGPPARRRSPALVAVLAGALIAGLVGLLVILHLSGLGRKTITDDTAWRPTAKVWDRLVVWWPQSRTIGPGPTLRPKPPPPVVRPTPAQVEAAFDADLLDRAVLEVLWPPAEEYPPLRPLLGPMLVWAYFREGTSSLRFTYFRREALSLLQRAANLDRLVPRRYRIPALYLALGRLYTEELQFRRAQDAYQHLLALDPGHQIGRFNLGFVLLRTSQYARAAEEYRRLARLKPYFLDDALVNLGIALYYVEATGRKDNPPFKKALKAFDDALKYNGLNMRAQNLRINIRNIRMMLSRPMPPPTTYFEIKVAPNQIIPGKTLPLLALWHTHKAENWKIIALENNLAYPYRLQAGQVLRIPREVVLATSPMTGAWAKKHRADVPDRLNPLPPRRSSHPSLDLVYQFPPVAPK